VEDLITGCAKKIVELLQRTGEVNIMNLCESLSERSVVGYQALGWLAHDGRISYRRQGSQVYVSLSVNPDSSSPGATSGGSPNATSGGGERSM
jgi:hypothetical protein